MPKILLNADLGEGCGNDQKILPFIDIANIACGGHTGNDHSMSQTVSAAIANHVDLSAHPSYPDPHNFGRQSIVLSADELHASIRSQLSALQRIAQQQRTEIKYIKPHGALYNDAATQTEISNILIESCYNFNPNIIIIGLANSKLLQLAHAKGFTCLAEGFIDRRYQINGQLAPRNRADAVISDVNEACQQALHIIEQQHVGTLCGNRINVDINTLCLHGDNPQAVELAQRVAQLLNNKVTDTPDLSV